MKKRIHILFGIEATVGGAAVHLTQLAIGLPKDQFEITVVASNNRTPSFSTNENILRKNGVKVIHVPMRRNIHLLHDVIALIRILRVLSDGHFDIIHAHSSKAGALFRIASWMVGHKITVYTPHTFHFYASNGLKRHFFAYIERSLAIITQKIVFVSKEEMQTAIDQQITHEPQAKLIYNGINLGYYNRMKYGYLSQETPSNAITIGGIGRSCYQKNWPLFFSIAKTLSKKYKKVKFLVLILGEITSIRQLIRKEGLAESVEIIPYSNNMPYVYAQLNILLNTSRWEGLPQSVMEAMAMEIPIVATDVQGNREIVLRQQTGFLFSPDEVSEAVQWLSILIEQPALRVVLGENSRRRIQSQFDLVDFLGEHHRMYAELVGEPFKNSVNRKERDKIL